MSTCVTQSLPDKVRVTAELPPHLLVTLFLDVACWLSWLSSGPSQHPSTSLQWWTFKYVLGDVNKETLPRPESLILQHSNWSVTSHVESTYRIAGSLLPSKIPLGWWREHSISPFSLKSSLSPSSLHQI